MEKLYYKIINSQVTIISDQEAKDLEKQWVFFTRGVEIDEEKIYDELGQEIRTDYTKVEIFIFDIDKNSILPEVKFLDSYRPNSWLPFNAFGPWFIFIVVLWAIFVYFQFFHNKDQTQTNTGSLLPVLSSLQSPISSWATTLVPVNQNIIEEQKPIENTGSIVPPVFSSVSDTEALQLQNKKKNYEYQDLQIEFQRQSRELDLCYYDLNDAKDIAKWYLQESLEKTTQIDELKKQTLENNQLYLYLWQYLFELCESKPKDAECKQLIYNFHNQK